MSSTTRAASASRKHLMSSVLSEFPIPDFSKGERIGSVIENKGGNQFLVEYADPHGTAVLTQVQCRLPSKFLNKIWIKRGDFVIIDSVEPTIVHALYPKQIDHLHQKELWPTIFVIPGQKPDHDSPESSVEDSSNDDSSDDELFRNTNRRAPSSDDDSDDETSDDDDE